jgi:hypothetical protein
MKLSTIAGAVSAGLAPPEVSYLVLAGGGGANTGGGGGAGGYRSSWNSETSGGGAAAESVLTLDFGTAYTVTVGAGGGTGGYGNASVMASITSTRGGRGPAVNPADVAGGPGGSGGGASAGVGPCPGASGGSRVNGQGYNGGPAGGNGGPGRCPSGGGGGAAQGGRYGTCYDSNRSWGGAGRASTITGSSVTRGRGGDGSGVPGPLGATTGQANSGSGAKHNSYTGGSGYVVMRFLEAYNPTVSAGLTYTNTTTGGDRILKFTAGSGTVTF